MSPKCPTCNGCTTTTWIAERKRAFWCFLCQKYYDKIDGKLVEIDKDALEKELLNDSN